MAPAEILGLIANMAPAEILGLIAASLTTVSFLPQVLLIFKTGKTDGISLLMYSLFVLGVALWLIYGLLISSRPVAIANTLTLLLAGSVLALTLTHRLRARRRKAQTATTFTAAKR